MAANIRTRAPQRISPKVVERILSTLDRRTQESIPVPAGESALRFRDALHQYFRRRHPVLRLETRSLPNERLLCWLTPR